MSLDPIAKNDVWATLAALQRRLRQLESVSGGGGFRTGDLLMSIRTHPDMLTTTLSDGGRPGWYLLNGATNPDMATTDPELYALLGDTLVLKDAKGRVLAGPKSGGAFVAGDAIGAESVLAALQAHTHGAGTLDVGGGPFVTAVSQVEIAREIPTGGSGGGFPLDYVSVTTADPSVTGSTGSTGSNVGSSVVQPTLVVGTVWVKR